MADGHSGHANYFFIFLLLCGCTALSILSDVIDIRGFGGTLLLIFVVLSISMAKALFVMLFFMHLKFEGRWKFVLLGPTIILACGIPLALMPDIGVHYYTVDVPQSHEVMHVRHDGEESIEHAPQPAPKPEPAHKD